MTVQIGLLLALGCAFATNLAFLWKHRGAVAAPEVDIRHPLRERDGPVRLQVVDDRLRGGARRLGPARRRAGAGSDLARAGGDLRRPRVPGRARRPLVRLRARQARVDGRRADGRRPRVPGPHGPDRLGGLALELLDLGHDRLRGRDGLPRRAAPDLAPGAAGSATAAASMLGAAAGILFGVSDISIKALTGTVPGDFMSIVEPVDAGRGRWPRSPPSTPRPAACRSARASSVIALTSRVARTSARSSAASSCSATRWAATRSRSSPAAWPSRW